MQLNLTRPLLFFDMDPESTTLVASDSHKLICYTTRDFQAPEKASFILHKKPASVLKSILDKDDEDVKIAFDSSTVVFTFGSTMMVCRLIVGKFPEYRKVIPQNNANILKIDRTQLLNTVRRVRPRTWALPWLPTRSSNATTTAVS